MKLYLLILLSLICCGMPDYTTTHGVDVYLGEKNRPTKTEVERWTFEAYMKWNEVRPSWTGCVSNSASAAKVYFQDKHPLRCRCGENLELIDVHGYVMWPSSMFIGHLKGKVGLIFIHEFGHIVANKCGGIWEGGHQLFKDVGYNY